MPRGIFCSLPPRPDLTCLGGKADHQSPRHLLGDLGVGDTVWGTEVHGAQQPHDPGSVLPVPQSLLLQGLRDFAPDCCLSTPAPLLSPSTPGQLPFLPAPPASPSHLTICPPTHTLPWLEPAACLCCCSQPGSHPGSHSLTGAESLLCLRLLPFCLWGSLVTSCVVSPPCVHHLCKAPRGPAAGRKFRVCGFPIPEEAASCPTRVAVPRPFILPGASHLWGLFLAATDVGVFPPKIHLKPVPYRTTGAFLYPYTFERTA